MAQVKEPYGLVYNTDGTLCTTYRDDVVPFRGVRSFAVETGTTNYVLFPVSFSTSPAGVSIEYLDDYTAKVTVTDATQITKNTDILFNGRCTVDANTTVTVSEYVESTNTSKILPRISGFGTMTDHEGKRYYKTVTHSSSWTFQVGVQIFATAVNGDYIIVSYPQIEIKPFASSFVNGTRPSGRLVIPVEDLKFDIANDDWVISYWKYPVSSRNDIQNDYNLMSLGQWITGLDKGTITWGKYVDVNKFTIGCTLNNKTQTYTYSPIFDSSWYFYNWHYEVIKKQGKVLNYYVDGVKQCELTIPADLELQTPFNIGFTVGGFYGSNPCNSLIAAPYYGYNSATWTDEYIREVYEAKIPFPAQNKLSIY